MKLSITILLIVLYSIISTNVSANPKINVQIKQNTVESLMIGLNSDNLGLKSSCIYMIGELQLSNAIIPLMKILRESENDDLRIAAALALYKIGTPLSVNAVKQAIRFDESERVSKHCADFYNDFLRNRFNDEETNMDVSKTALK